MASRASIPVGAPCWADLWTSDVDGSREFYPALFGWKALDAAADFGGYWMFECGSGPIAGGMGSPEGVAAGNVWTVYFCTDAIDARVSRATAAGAAVRNAPMAVADLGVQAVLTDPTGAVFGLWQPGTFQGFSATAEPGTPSWFEMHTRSHGRAVDFYQEVFGWVVDRSTDTDDFRYYTCRTADDSEDVLGMMDARAWLPEGNDAWSVYWDVDDTEAAVTKARSLGASVLQGPDTTPYGVLATLADPTGAQFKLRQAG